MDGRPHRVAARVAALIVAVVGMVGGTAGTALAHASLEFSTPSANSVLETGPPAIVLDFDETIESDLASIRLFDGAGGSLEVGPAAVGADDSVVSVAVPELEDGVYAVIWRVNSSDGHVVDGAFSFQVGTATGSDGAQLIDQVRSGVPGAQAVRWWYGVARFLSLLGALALIGAGWWLLRPSLDLASRRSARRMCAVAGGLFLLGSAGAFGLFGAQAVGGSLSDATSPSVWGDVATTQTGRMLLLRLAVALLLAGLILLVRQRGEGWWRGAAAAASIVALFSFSAAGHPNSLDPAALWIAIDMAHLASVAVWLGGLFALVIAGGAALGTPEGERFVRRFSLAATFAVPVIVATGVAQGLKLAGGVDDVTATDWGRLLLTKVTVVVVVLALGGVSRWLLAHDGAASVRRTVIVEAVLGVVVIALAAGMVALPPAPPVVARPFAEQLSSNGLIAVVSIGPGSIGSNEIHIVITPPGGALAPVASVSARVSLPVDDIPASPVTLVREGPNHYSGTVTFPRGGEWTLELIVQVTETESVLLKSTVSIP